MSQDELTYVLETGQACVEKVIADVQGNKDILTLRVILDRLGFQLVSTAATLNKSLPIPSVLSESHPVRT